MKKYINSTVKAIFSLFLLSFFTTGAFAQSDDWQVLTQKDGVEIKYKYSDCDLERGFDQEWVLLQFNNTTATKKTLIWDLELYFNNDCKTCGSDEYHLVQELKPNESMEGICSVNTNTNLRIFSKFLNRENRTELTDFKLANLQVVSAK